MTRAALLGTAFATLALAGDRAHSAGHRQPHAVPSRPDVLVISVDTLRPDALGWVAGRNPTPAMDALAREGVRFPAAVSPAPLTMPAHVSLMTGLLPRRHGVRDNGQVLGNAPATLAEALRAKGYATAAFIGGYPLRASFGLDRGFERYDDALPPGEDAWRERPAPETTAAALAWLRSQAAAASPRAPFFLFVHYYDAHDPYTPPERLRGPGPRGAYDGEVRYVDEAVGELRRGLQDLRLDRSLLTILLGDHGESLGEHGEDTHGFFVYDATVLVPLVFHFPGRLAPRASTAPARLVDVAPTVLGLLGLDPPPSIDGASLVPVLRGQRAQIGPAYVESQQPWLGYGWAPLASVRAEGWKLIAAPRPELFDLRADPREQSNLYDLKPEVARRLSAELRRIEGGAPAARRPPPDPETLQRLRALGYVGGAATAFPPSATGPGLADPKDRLAQKAALAEADALLLRHDAARALARLDTVLAAEPDTPLGLLRSAAALVELGRPREAIPRLKRLIGRDPDHAEAHYQLADALTRAGDRRHALAEWQETLRLQPRRAVAWSNLGAVLAQSGRTADAEAALERAHALEPGNAALAENLGAVRYELALAAARSGRADEARQRLRDALAADPALRQTAARDARLAPLLP
jgi:choline-sulfatase